MKHAFLVLTLGLAASMTASADILEQILVKVNGEILTKTDLEERQVAALRQRNRGVTAADLKNDAELKKALDEITPQILVDAVDEMLVLQRGRELGYKMGDEQFKSIVDNIRKENKLEDEAQFQAALKQEGMTLADLRKTLERQLVVSRVQQVEVWNKIGITETEARGYYEEHQSEFTTPAQLTLREILIPVAETKTPAGQEGVSVAADEEARNRADRIRVRAVGGEDFAKLAAAESDSPSKANGGLIGPINEQELATPLRQLLERMKPGEISQPLRTPRGYQILKLESRTDTTVMGFEDARDQIGEKVFQQKRRGEMQKYLARLRRLAIIEWKNDELRKLYEQRLSTAPTAEAAGPS
jgi:peptidyl-prolyl cis-trans isomerase SurA